MQQIIKEPTHVSTVSSSCIDLIFTSQHSLITDSGVHFALHPNWAYILYTHHLIYQRSGTTEKQTQSLLDVPSKNLIRKEHFWTRASMAKLIFLTELFLIFLSNHIPYEIIVCNGKDPPWVNNRIKTLIQEKKYYI